MVQSAEVEMEVAVSSQGWGRFPNPGSGVVRIRGGEGGCGGVDDPLVREYLAVWAWARARRRQLLGLGASSAFLVSGVGGSLCVLAVAVLSLFSSHWTVKRASEYC